MKRPVRILLSIAVGLLLSAALAGLAIYVANGRTRRQAEALLSSIRRLNLGKTTLDDSRPIRIEYGAKTDPLFAVSGSTPERSYSIGRYNDIASALSLNVPGLVRFGVLPSGILVNLRYREEKLSYLSYSFHTAALSATGRPREIAAEVQFQERAASNNMGSTILVLDCGQIGSSANEGTLNLH
jgi:hypothetical protein